MIGGVVGVGIVANLILAIVLGTLFGGWVPNDSVILDDSQKVSERTIVAVLVGFVAGFIGFTVGSMVGTQIVS